jgi:elongator complex protein 3
MTSAQLKNTVLKILLTNPSTEKELFNLARKEFGKSKDTIPDKSQLLAAYKSLVKSGKIPLNKKFEQFLLKRAVRTMSGVAVISVLTKAHPCPGKCLYCPAEKTCLKVTYLTNHVMRAILAKFDPTDRFA